MTVVLTHQWDHFRGEALQARDAFGDGPAAEVGRLDEPVAASAERELVQLRDRRASCEPGGGREPRPGSVERARPRARRGWRGDVGAARHRLEAKGWIDPTWELSNKGKRARFYRLTPLGRKQLAAEQSKWNTFSRAMALILNPVDQEAQ